MSAHPGVLVERWLAAVPGRHSRRVFDGRPLPAADAEALDAMCRSFAPYPDARVAFLKEAAPAIFTGLVGSYGKVTDAPSAFVFIADSSSPTCEEHTGYTGEGLVLEANARGLQTCWISGSFSRATTKTLVELREGEVVKGVSPVGYARQTPTTTERVLFGAGRDKHRRSLDQIAPGHEGWPAWAQAGVAAARVAPSAMNRQPWRFALDGEAVVLTAGGGDLPGASGRLDCGIAMMHFELGARSQGADGEWTPSTDHEIARWEPSRG